MKRDGEALKRADRELESLTINDVAVATYEHEPWGIPKTIYTNEEIAEALDAIPNFWNPR